MANVLIYIKLNENEKEMIREAMKNYAKVFFRDEITEEKILREIEIIIAGSGLDIIRSDLPKMQNLKFVQILAAGADHVPFKLLPESVIVASNAGANAIPVAEHAMGLLHAIIKNICYHDYLMRKGKWDRRKYGRLIYGKNACIIGFGFIGCELAKRLSAYGVKVYGFNRSGKSKCGEISIDGIYKISKIYDFVEKCDFIFVSLPLNKDTRGFINLYLLQKMKKDAILINVGRGPVINIEDLYKFLKEHPEFKVGLDVWWDYPDTPYKENFYQKLPFHELENVVMTPHIAGFAREIRIQVFTSALENVIRFIEGKEIRNIVNREDYL